MGNRLLQELNRLEAPPAVVDLAHGLDFMAAYLQDPAQFESGFEDVLQRCIYALIDTGGV
ncbi:MAG: hypothetical protein KF698_08400 [Anaerolineales bacterium]|nr:hypothetical protein [Anaerolineales bacterium]